MYISTIRECESWCDLDCFSLLIFYVCSPMVILLCWFLSSSLFNADCSMQIVQCRLFNADCSTQIQYQVQSSPSFLMTEVVCPMKRNFFTTVFLLRRRYNIYSIYKYPDTLLLRTAFELDPEAAMMKSLKRMVQNDKRLFYAITGRFSKQQPHYCTEQIILTITYYFILHHCSCCC